MRHMPAPAPVDRIVPDESQPARVDWLSIAVFYVIACAVSWPFFWWRDMERASWVSWRVPGILKTMTYMDGPAIGAIAALLLFRGRHVRRITMLGTSPLRSLLFLAGPLAILSALNDRPLEGVPPHLVGVLILCASMLTILGEELGWRGFLQDALRPLPRYQRYALIGVMWELWHFTNRTTHRPLLSVVMVLAISYPTAILLSWIIGETVERTRSVLVAVSLHAWLNLIGELPSPRTMVTLAIGLALWAALLWRWPRAPVDPPSPAAGAAGPPMPDAGTARPMV